MSSEIKRQPLTMKQASRGKVVHLHKYWKGIMASIADPESRGQFKRLMIDATMTEHEQKLKKRKDKDIKETADE